MNLAFLTDTMNGIYHEFPDLPKPAYPNRKKTMLLHQSKSFIQNVRPVNVSPPVWPVNVSARSVNVSTHVLPSSNVVKHFRPVKVSKSVRPVNTIVNLFFLIISENLFVLLMLVSLFAMLMLVNLLVSLVLSMYPLVRSMLINLLVPVIVLGLHILTIEILLLYI